MDSGKGRATSVERRKKRGNAKRAALRLEEDLNIEYIKLTLGKREPKHNWEDLVYLVLHLCTLQRLARQNAFL